MGHMKGKNMKKFTAILLFAALLGTVVGCSQDDSDDAVTTAATTAASTEEEIPGDTLLVAEGYHDLDFSKYLNLPELSSIKVPLAQIEAEWTTLCDEICRANMVFTDAAETDVAAINDEVNIHYKGYAASANVTISDATLQNMTNISYDDEGNLSSGYDLVLGSNSFIRAYESEEHPENNNPGFEEQLVGAKVGETRTITVTFPDNYGSEELNGTVVKFDVTINSLRKGALPTLTDQMVSDYTSQEYTTIDALNTYIDSYYKNNLSYTAIADAVEIIAYPDELIDSAIADYVTNYISATYEEELTEEEAKTVFDEQYENAKTSAETTVGERILLEYLFKQFDISLTQAEYIELRDADFERNYIYYVYYYGISDVETLESYFGKDILVTQFKYEKLIPLLPDRVTFE